MIVIVYFNIANPQTFSLNLFPEGTASSHFGILPTNSHLLNIFVKVTSVFNMKLSFLQQQAWVELQLTERENFAFSGLYLVLFGFFFGMEYAHMKIQYYFVLDLQDYY